MSSDSSHAREVEAAYELLSEYQDDPVGFAEEVLDVQLADTQKEILEAIRDHERTLIVSGNGTGKSYAVTIGALWFYLVNYNSLSLLTSGNYDLITDASWRPMKTLHKRAQQRFDLPGRRLESPPRIETEATDEWFLRYLSPRHPDNLEGRHARRALVVIEEADKPDISAAHFDSATSTASSADDRIVAVANPPQDRANVVYDKMQDNRWRVIQFSSFDSHNVKAEIDDDTAAPPLPGLVDLDVLREDWEAWNSRPWPGAREAAQYQADLDPRWYRRRLGEMPPVGTGTLRPWYERDVEAAVERWHRNVTGEVSSDRDGLGADIARGGGDRTAVVERRGPLLHCVVERDAPGDHTRNEQLLLDAYDDAPVSGNFLIDAVGEGSGVADRVRKQRSGVKRFQAGTTARDDTEYYDARTEALVELGDLLEDRAIVEPGTTLERELRMGARALELEERTLRENTVLKASGKDTLKQTSYLGRSPDVLDAAMLAVYAEDDSEFVLHNITGRVA